MSHVPPLAGVIGTLPLPNTAPTPEVGETVKAADVQGAVQALLNQDATIEALFLALAGGTMTGAITLAAIPSCLVLPNGGTIQLQSGSAVDAATGVQIQALAGSRMIIAGRRIRGARTVLTDLDHTIAHTTSGAIIGGTRFEVSSTPALVRTITIDKNTVVPLPHETIDVLMPGPTATGQAYKFKRNDGTTIAEFWGNAAGDAGAWAEFEYDGGVWRLGANSGGGSAGGVLSGPGA
jgi:hypothetical protein